MALRYCPRCMKEREDPLQCEHCGFVDETYQPKPFALPAGTEVGPCTVGIVLGTSRQAICYSAMDARTGKLVLLEELFPPAAVKREGKNVVQEKPEARWAEAVERFARAEAAGRCMQVTDVLRENQTAYRVYAAELKDGQTPEELADMLLDQPIRFRDEKGHPLFAINAIPIPPLPPETTYTGNQPGKRRKKKGWLLAMLIILLLALGATAAVKLGLLDRLFP